MSRAILLKKRTTRPRAYYKAHQTTKQMPKKLLFFFEGLSYRHK